jgi:hypothetical protein
MLASLEKPLQVGASTGYQCGRNIVTLKLNLMSKKKSRDWGAQKQTGDSLKLVQAEFSFISWAVSMMCMYLFTWMHAHIYS